jgi:quercetin dioxygenase-like cupin family protein
MKYAKSTTVIAAILCTAAMSQAYAQSAAPAPHLMVAPSDLKWTAMPSLPCGAQLATIEGPMNEAKSFTVRVKFPANCKIPPHYHPAVEHVTVISGAFGMGTGDTHDTSKGMSLPVGGISVMQPNVHHFGWTTQETIVQVHGVGPWGITYINPADDPSKKTN